MFLFMILQTVISIAPPAPPYSQTYVSINYKITFDYNVSVDSSLFLSGFKSLLMNDTEVTIYALPPTTPKLMYLTMTDGNYQRSSYNNASIFTLTTNAFSSAVHHNVSEIKFLIQAVNVLYKSPSLPPIPPSPPSPFPPPITPPLPPFLPPNLPSQVSTATLDSQAYPPPQQPQSETSETWIITSIIVVVLCACIIMGCCGVFIFRFATRNSNITYRIRLRRTNIDFIKQTKVKKVKSIPKKEEKTDANRFSHIQLRH